MSSCNLRPMEFNVVVMLDKAQEKTTGGIILPLTTVDKDKLSCEEGELVAVSPHAFTYADWPENETPPKVGDRVLIARYAGVLRERGGRDYRIVKDKDIVAVVETAAAVREAA